MTQSDYIEIFIPHLPPGINQTYRIIKRNDKAGLAKTPAANRWDEEAALIVGAAAGKFEFEADLAAEYQIIVRWWGGETRRGRASEAGPGLCYKKVGV